MKHRCIVCCVLAALLALLMSAADMAAASAGSAQTELPGEADPTAAPAQRSMTDKERALMEHLGDSVPSQEGWFVEFTSQNKLVMLSMPDLLVWTVPDQGELLELDWFIDLSTLLGDAEGNPALAPSPDAGSMLLCTSDHTVYMLTETSFEKIRTLDNMPDEMFWSTDGSAYAIRTDDLIYVYDMSGAKLTLTAEPPLMPTTDFYSMLSGAELPAALQAMVDNPALQYMGANDHCVLFDSESTFTSAAYIFQTGKTVNYPDMLFSASEISATGCAPIYDTETARYRLYLPDSTWLDSPLITLINTAEMANPYGWLADTFCVLDQSQSRTASFSLNTINIQTSEERTLIPKWDE